MNDTPIRLTAAGVLLGLMIAVAVLNLATFAAADPPDSDRYRAINRYETADVLQIGLDVSPHFVEFYAPFLALASHAPGANVFKSVREDGYFDEEFDVRARGFGQARAVVQVDFDPVALVDDVDWEGHVVARGEGGDRGPPFALALVDEEADEVIAAGSEDFLLLVDRRLVAASWESAS